MKKGRKGGGRGRGGTGTTVQLREGLVDFVHDVGE